MFQEGFLQEDFTINTISDAENLTLTYNGKDSIFNFNLGIGTQNKKGQKYYLNYFPIKMSINDEFSNEAYVKTSKSRKTLYVDVVIDKADGTKQHNEFSFLIKNPRNKKNKIKRILISGNSTITKMY